MALNIYDHGSCCGAKVIDGFWCQDSYRAQYRRNYPTYDEARLDEIVSRNPTHVEVMQELKTRITDNRSTRGQFMVVLNNDQNTAWQDDLINRFGFQLLYSDVANPNHPNDITSRLWTYIYVTRAYKGDRDAVGLPEEGRLGTPMAEVVLPEPPPLPPLRPIPTANLPYGVRI